MRGDADSFDKGLALGRKVGAARMEAVIYPLIEDFCNLAERLTGQDAKDLYEVTGDLETVLIELRDSE